MPVPAHRSRKKTITTRDKEKFLDGLRQGLTVRHAAESAAHPAVSFHSMAARDAKFAEAKRLAIEVGTDVLEDEAARRGLLGYEVPVWGKVAPGIDGQIGTEVRYSDRLLEVLLKGRRPEYRDNPRIDFRNQTLVVTPEDRSASIEAVVAVFKELGLGLENLLPPEDSLPPAQRLIEAKPADSIEED